DLEGRWYVRFDRTRSGAGSEAVEAVGPWSRVPVPEHHNDLIPAGRRPGRAEPPSARAQMGDLPAGRHGRETDCDESTQDESAPDTAAGGDRKRHPHREDALSGPAGVIRRAGAHPTGLRVGS